MRISDHLFFSMRRAILRRLLTAFGAVCGARAAATIDSWTRHDPDFPVRVTVMPFADEQWNAALAESMASERNGVLPLHSAVLNVSLDIPKTANVTSTEVSVTLFEPQPNSDDSNLTDFAVLADTQVQHARVYRLDVGPRMHEIVLRVYVEAHQASGRVMRAFYVRPVNIAPSEPLFLECPDVGELDIALRVATYPPTNIPVDLCKGYTMDGRVPIRKWYIDDQSDLEGKYQERSFEFIEALVDLARKRKLTQRYGVTDEYLFAALDEFPVHGKHVLIVGSMNPWYEAICVAKDAASCTTIEYNRLRYNHPKIQTFTNAEFDRLSTRKHFDAIFSISSLEHDGLGRYGDPLDPDADLKAMRDLLRYTSPGSSSKLFVAVPVGSDAVVWNAHRVYGSLRLPMFLQDWKLVESFGFSTSDLAKDGHTGHHQPVFVLEPKGTVDEAHTEL